MAGVTKPRSQWKWIFWKELWRGIDIKATEDWRNMKAVTFSSDILIIRSKSTYFEMRKLLDVRVFNEI